MWLVFFKGFFYLFCVLGFMGEMRGNGREGLGVTLRSFFGVRDDSWEVIFLGIVLDLESFIWKVWF